MDLNVGMTKSQFVEFILSTKLNNIVDTTKTGVKEQDMKYNLQNYFCFSSHNTYLSGH